MSNEPQRDIEKDLLAYKQRRHGQLGAPLELHPATRKMLQGEAARTASRPLLTSEEAAKNFVRSFVMSHQQPGFFARHKPRILWGGAMFACLALVLAVLRNDPQRRAQQDAFTDALPAPSQVSDAQGTQPQSAVAANQPHDERERLARDRKLAPSADEARKLAQLSAAPAGSLAPANPRGATVAATPLPPVQRESLERRSGTAATPLPAISTATSNERGASTPAPTSGRAVAKSESTVSRTLAMDADKKPTEKPMAGELVKLSRALKDTEATEVKLAFEAKKATEEFKVKLSDESKRAQTPTVAGVAGGAGISPAAGPAAASAPQRAGGYGAAELGQVRQQYQQVDTRALLRANLNSPPVPEVMKEFAFERSGDRVRIVDADGSAYEGSVLPAPVEEATRAKAMRELDELKARPAIAGQSAQAAGVPATDTQLSYRFYASGVNRKLNQSVEFRGEWLPAAPTQSPPATPALQPASLGAVRLESQVLEKKEKTPVTNTLSSNTAPAQNYRFQQAQKEPPAGLISGRAVVGGKNEFDIKAVSK